MAKHAVLSASGAHRWLACPGSIRLCEGLPKTSSTYAEEGTAAHAVAELCLRTDQQAADRIGTIVTVNGTPWTVTEEMAEAVQVYLDVVRGEYKTAGDTADMWIERKFRLDWLYPNLFGTNDAAVGDDAFGILKVFDYKHGAGVPVEVENNPQLMYYALGAAKGSGYDEVELVVVQPRAVHPGGPVRRWTISTEDLMTWGEEVLLPGAKATEALDAPLCVGEHCRFCQALAICPEQKNQTLAVAKQAFQKRSLPAPDALTVPELRKILDVSDMIEAWLGACRAHVRALLDNGMTTPEESGYKLVAGRKTRSWLDEAKAEEWLTAILDEEAYVPRKLVSPAQAEKVLKGAEAKKAIVELTQETRGTQMVPLSDKREALTPAAIAFGEFKED